MTRVVKVCHASTDHLRHHSLSRTHVVDAARLPRLPCSLGRAAGAARLLAESDVPVWVGDGLGQHR